MSSQTVVIRQIVHRETFIEGCKEHVDGLAGYVKKFLKKNEGRLDEYGRAWSVESCADVLKIPGSTLRRWLGTPADQQGSAPYTTPAPERQRVRSSTTRSVLSDADERRGVLAELPTEVRDELRAELIDIDIPKGSKKCRHCPSHCPEGGH